MDDPETLIWIFIVICTLLTLLVSVIHLSLRQIAWARLEDIFTAQGYPERTDILRKNLTQLITGTSELRLLLNLAVILCVLYAFTSSPSATSDPASLRAALPLVESFVVAALILLVFSVVIPHSWSKYGGTSLVIGCYPLIRIIGILVWPLTLLLRVFDPLVRKLAGVSLEDINGRLEEKQEELLSVVEEQKKEGVVDEEEQDMIESVLEFRATTVGEIMTPRIEVVGLDVNSSMSETVETIIQQGYSRYPVYEESIDKIIGMLYAKDLLLDLAHPDQAAGIQRHLRKAYFVPESKSLRDLLHDFQNQKVHLAVVLDEYGGTAGVITIEDILEELVGEIVDEYETPQDEINMTRIDEHTLEMDARYDVDRLNDELELNIPDDDGYETIGGFIFSKLGYIPHTGETFAHENLKFTILDAGQRKINRVRIEVKPPQPAEEEE